MVIFRLNSLLTCETVDKRQQHVVVICAVRTTQHLISRRTVLELTDRGVKMRDDARKTHGLAILTNATFLAKQLPRRLLTEYRTTSAIKPLKLIRARGPHGPLSSKCRRELASTTVGNGRRYRRERSDNIRWTRPTTNANQASTYRAPPASAARIMSRGSHTVRY